MSLKKPASLFTLLGLLVSGSAHAQGDTWVPLGPAGAQVYALAIDPSNPMTIYAATRTGILRSTEGGANWEAVNTGLTILDARTLAVDPVNPMTIYAGTFFGGVPRSNDGGDNWQEGSLADKGVQALAIDPDDPTTLYAGTFVSGIFKSTSGSANWNVVNPTRFVLALAIDPAQPLTVYAGIDDDGVLKTTDGGANWQSRNNGITQLNVQALAVDPVTPQTLYAGTFAGGVFKSTDGAATWQSMSNGLPGGGPPFLSVKALAISPTDPMTVYAAVDGVFRSSDGGATWEALRDGFTGSFDVRALAIDPVNQRVYAGNFGHGVFVLPPPSVRWLYAGGDVETTGTRFDALALTNFSDTTANLELEAIPASQQPAILTRSLAGDDNFASIELPAGEQTARLRSNLFGGNSSLPAWIELISDTSEIGVFFQFGTNSLSQLDGGVAIDTTSRQIALTRIFDGPAAFRGQSATTRVSIFNPNPEPVTIELTYRPPGNGSAGQGPSPITRIIPPRSVLDERAGDLFDSTLSGSQGPALEGGVLSGEVTEGEGVVAFEVIQLTDQDTVIGLNAATGNPFSRAYSAQLASEPGVFTSVNLSNRATAERNVKLRAVNEDGSDRGDPVLFTLAPGEQFTEDAGVLFGGGSTPPTLSQGAPFRGSLIVEADGDGIVGDVLFGDPDKFAYAASVPLQTETFKEALFNQVANVSGIFTGLAFFYPGPDAEASPQQGPQGPHPRPGSPSRCIHQADNCWVKVS